MNENSSAGIVVWLKSAGLEQYVDVFRKEVITFDDLPNLTESDIDRLELPTGPRRKLLLALSEFSKDGVRENRGGFFGNQSVGADRRQLTVMFCDLVGSTALAERLDPEENKALIREYRNAVSLVVEEYGGHVKQFQGDAVKVYFGWPLAHEDAAERCVRAGLEVVQAVHDIRMRPHLEVRIGVATGEVAVDEEDAVGTTPNRAARLQQEVAATNQIVIADSTRRLVGDAFELDDLGSHSLKGVLEPLRAWLVTGIGKAESRFEATRHGVRTPLVGRVEVINLLTNLSAQRSGSVVSISGEPGIGKSRVLSELHNAIKPDGAAVMHFQCLPYHSDSAFWPIVDFLERRLGFAHNESSEDKFEKLRGLIPKRLPNFEQALALVASLMSISDDGLYRVPAMTPQKQKEVTIDTLLALISSAANAQRTVVLFEDLHWIDASTVEVLDRLIDIVKDVPLLVVLSHRPEFKLRWGDLDHVTALTLKRLSSEQSKQIITKVAGDRSISAELLDQLVNRSDGVPLYAEEITKLILEQLDDVGEEQLSIDTDTSIRIPTTLRDSLRARLDRDSKVMQISQIGSAIGREFSYELISTVTNAVLDTSQVEVDDMLDRLTASGLAFSEGKVPQATYSFKHALVREEAYESIPKKDRLPKLHREIACAMEVLLPAVLDTEPELLAHHFAAANQPDRAAQLWSIAGANALGKWTLIEAISHYENCLKEISRFGPDVRDGEERELECRLLLSLAYEAYGGWPSQQLADVLKPALPLARKFGEPMALARTLWGLWVQNMSVGPVEESLYWAEECLTAGRQRHSEELEMVGRMSVMVCNFWLGNYTVVRKHAEAILNLYDRERHKHIVFSMNHDPKTLAGIYLSQVLWILGFPDQGAALVEERDDHARSVGHPFDTGFVLTLGAWVYHYRREPEELVNRHEEIMSLADDAGLPFISLVLAPFLSSGLSHVQLGNLERGIEDMEAGLNFWEGAGAKAVIPYVKSQLGEAMAAAGDLNSGLSHINDALAQIDRPGWQERSHVAEIYRLKGWILSLLGDVTGAEGCFLQSIDWARKQSARSWELRTATSLARLWAKQQRQQEAIEMLAPVYEWFSEGFGTKDLAEAKELLQSLKLACR